MSKYKINFSDCLMFVLITIGFFSISDSIASQNCLNNDAINKPVLARYEINTQTGNKKQSTSLVLVRSDNRVSYSSDGVIEVWERISNNKIKLYKYFEQAERGIEYQPVDIVNAEKIDWITKRQLISDQFLQQFELIKQKNKNCELHQLYKSPTNQPEKNKQSQFRKQSKNESLKLVWLSSVKLPKTIQYKQHNGITRWTLLGLETQVDKITQYMQELDSYSLVDYSDIGDNESDPFLQKMINLGFVAHSDPFYYSSKKGIYTNPSRSHEHAH